MTGLFSASASADPLIPLMDKLCTTVPSGSPQQRLNRPTSSTKHTALRQCMPSRVAHRSQEDVRLRSATSHYPKGQKVVVRSKDVGFYYPGELAVCVDHSVLEFLT